ncbi:MAG: chemotaxis protein CheX [Archangiaceae bacterium]|nr:chemotaxis protein CheX [Archangiaceae bacterium]
MSQTLRPSLLAGVTRAVLGDAAFLFCDDADDAAKLAGRFAEATIAFDAPCPGRVTLRLPWPLAVEAAANLLGCERDDPDADQNALPAAAELLNMISGPALEAWFGASAKWALGVPSTRAYEGTLPTQAPTGELVGFVVDGARIELEVVETGASHDSRADR